MSEPRKVVPIEDYQRLVLTVELRDATEAREVAQAFMEARD